MIVAPKRPGHNDSVTDKPAWIPARPHRKERKPALLSEVLVGAQEYAQKRSGTAMGRSEWTAIVGEKIARRTRVGPLKAGCLTVKVASSAWSQELSFLKEQLIQKLNRAGHDVREMKLYVSRLDSPEAPSAQKTVGRARPVTSPLPPELLRRLEKVEDENLRAAISEAARHSLAQRPR